MGGFRELMVVFAVALVGLVVVAMVAFTPWYGATFPSGPAQVVGVQ